MRKCSISVVSFVLASLSTAAVASTGSTPGTFLGYALLEFNTEAGWLMFQKCELDVLLPQGGGNAVSQLICHRHNGGSEQVARNHVFSSDQTTSLREMLRNADLFGEGRIGSDTRATDGGLAVLVVSDSNATTALVVSGNPSFESPGPRNVLSSWLRNHQNHLIEEWRLNVAKQ